MWRCIFATLIINKILIFPSVSAENKAMVTIESCRILTEHIPADDVIYKGGVDVRGRPVKGADLPQSSNLAPTPGLDDKISFQLILDVAKENRLKKFQDHPGLRGEIYLGEIVIENGKVTLDGKPLAAQLQKDLNEFCQKSRNLP